MVKIKDAPPAKDASFHLRAIYLRQSESWTANDFDPTVGNQTLESMYRTAGLRWTCSELHSESSEAINPSSLLTCTITFRFEFVYLDAAKRHVDASESDELPEDAVVAKIIADISTDYAIARDSHPTDQEIEAWATNNTILHAWPYWREYCHNTMMRMALPLTIMPLVQRNAQQDNVEPPAAPPVAKRNKRRSSE